MDESVKSVMEPATIVPLDLSVQNTVELMRQEQTDRVYLVDRQQQLVGVITDFALLKAALRGEASESQLGCFAAPIQEFLRPDQPLSQAALFFRSGFRTEMAVLEQGELVGVVRRLNVLSRLLETGPSSQPRHSPAESLRSPSEPAPSGLRKIG